MDRGWTTVRYGRRRRNHSPAIQEPPHRSPDHGPSWGPRHHRRPSPPRRPVLQNWYRSHEPRHDNRPRPRPLMGQRPGPHRYQPQPVTHQRRMREMARPRSRQRHPLQRGQPGGYPVDPGWSYYDHGKASAPPRPRRWDSHPAYTQPAPPYRGSRGRGPARTTRSYADVTRDQAPNQVDQQVRRLPADDNLRLLIRDIYAFIRATHHLQQVAPDSGLLTPPTINRMINTLSSMIKPALPTPATLLLIEGAAKHWGHTVCLVLKQHHEDHGHKLMQCLTGRLTGDWLSAFQVAARWARRNLPHLGPDTLSVAEALLSSKACHDAAPSPAPSPPTPPPAPPAPLTPAPAPQREPRPRRSRPRPQRRAVSSPGITTGTPHHAPTEVLRTATSSAVETRSRDGPLPPPPPTPSTEDDTDPEDFIAGTPPVENPLTASYSAMKIRARNVPPPTPIPLAADDTDSSDSITAPSSSDATASSSDDDDGTSDLDMVEQVMVPHVSNNTTLETEYAANRHLRTKDKFNDWELTVNKTWLIIGDSNVSRVPTYRCPILQIESYPGANFHHALTLFQTVTPRQNVIVKKIIMSFGINSRRDRNISNQADYAFEAWETARRRFPKAEITIQLLNFSGALHPAEQDALCVLNELLATRTPTIGPLPEEHFSTCEDLIHWSDKTAESFLEHWMCFLNPGPL